MTIFEIIYWLALLVELIIRVPINAKRKEQKISDQRVDIRERLSLSMLWFGMMALPIVYSATRWLDFANYSLPTWASWVGVGLMLGALFIFWRSHADLGLNWSPSLQIRNEHNLVTNGIYGIIRHPMYASHCLWVLAQALLLPNWIAGFLNIVIFVIFYFMRVGPEEKMMLDTFGDQYKEYMKRTGGIFPRIG